MNTQQYLISHGVAPRGRKPKTIWLVAPPKTGSTWTSQMLRWSFLWPIVSLLPKGMGLRAQEIIVPEIYLRSKTNIFLPHHHTQASEPSVSFVQEFAVLPVLQMRNIFDTTLSVIDHLTQDGIKLPITYIPSSFRTESFETRAEIVASLVMPWYIGFYGSWFAARQDETIPLHIIQYEKVLEDCVRELAAVLTYAGEQRNINVFNAAKKAGSQHELTRFNKGIAGRGKIQLPSECLGYLSELCRIHKDPMMIELQKYLFYESTTSTTMGSDADSPSKPAGAQTAANPPSAEPTATPTPAGTS